MKRRKETPAAAPDRRGRRSSRSSNNQNPAYVRALLPPSSTVKCRNAQRYRMAFAAAGASARPSRRGLSSTGKTNLHYTRQAEGPDRAGELWGRLRHPPDSPSHSGSPRSAYRWRPTAIPLPNLLTRRKNALGERTRGVAVRRGLETAARRTCGTSDRLSRVISWPKTATRSPCSSAGLPGSTNG